MIFKKMSKFLFSLNFLSVFSKRTMQSGHSWLRPDPNCLIFPTFKENEVYMCSGWLFYSDQFLKFFCSWVARSVHLRDLRKVALTIKLTLLTVSYETRSTKFLVLYFDVALFYSHHFTFYAIVIRKATFEY